ncbi:MAG: hypothetical protein GWO24_25775, partial [Akkermansiaceae bacterium]|nr:hypothetical protein [Akkermansiaceae bacterium]
LKKDLDPDHPDPVTRDRWEWVQKELKTFDQLPKPLLPVPEGSPLLLMEPDDPDGRWRTVLDRSPAEIAPEVDRLAAQAHAVEQIVLWQDVSGITDPHRALDLHLLSKPAPELRALR